MHDHLVRLTGETMMFRGRSTSILGMLAISGAMLWWFRRRNWI